MEMTAQQLVEQYIPLADKLAFKRKKTLPLRVDIDDLKSAAYLGLVEAAARYDSDRGVSFVTFAYTRIWGAITDYLREQNWGKRGSKQQTFSLNASDDHNTSEEIAAKSEFNYEESFDVIVFSLEDHAKEVMRSYLLDEFSMKEVGEKFGVSESRISQLIKKYKCQIKQKWLKEDLWSELAA